MRSLALAVGCLLLLVSAGSAPVAIEVQPVAGTALLVEGGRLIRGDGSPPIERSAMLVERGTIVRIAAQGELPLPHGATRVDVTGKTVMPALIDTHAHVGYRKGWNQELALEYYTRENLIDQLNLLAYYGVAAVMSFGGDRDLAYNLRAEPHSGALLRTAGRGIAVSTAGLGNPNYPVTGGVGGVLNSQPYGVKTPEDARKAVQELAPKKPDFIKFWVDDRNGTIPRMSPAIYRAIIDEAHKHGIRAVVHTVKLEDVKDLLRSGIDGFAHAVWRGGLDDELIELFKQRPKVFTISTSGSGGRNELPGSQGRPAWLDEPFLRDVFPPAAIKTYLERERGMRPATQQASWASRNVPAVAKLMAAGVPIVAGSDLGGNCCGPFIGWGMHIEMASLVLAGMTPAQAIAAATKNAAEVLRLDQLGTLAPGKSADFLVLDANPLDDIANTRRIARVYLRGQEIDRSRLRKSWTAGTQH